MKESAILNVLDVDRRMPYAVGQCMKNPALQSVVLDGQRYERGQHRAFWRKLRNRKDMKNITIHMSF